MRSKHARDHPFKWADFGFYAFMIITWSAVGIVFIMACNEIVNAYMSTI